MASKIKQYPVDSGGNMIEYPDYHNKPAAWVDIKEFEATMTFVRYEKGRSSLRFILEDENGKKWSMMAQCIDDFVFRANSGTISGKWVMCKRGANYGLLLMQ